MTQLLLFLHLTTFLLGICFADKIEHKDLRIVGGNLSDLHQFPYQVGLFFHKHLERDYSFCGGSIISENYILTAARCLKAHNISTINILFGARNVSNWESGYQYQTLRASNSNVIVHEDYDVNGYRNDIGLIKLSESLVFDDGIQAVKIPAFESATGNEDYVGENGTIAGWGHYKEDEFAISPQQYYANVTVISNTDCSLYDDDFKEYLTSNNLCTAGNGTVSLCEGDYGGALVVNGTQIAIMSWYWDERDTCFIGYPSVYTKISPYRTWIKENSGV